jgi:hypothetical protein
MARATLLFLPLFLTLPLGASTACAADAGALPVPIYRELKDWILACDNTRTCQAKFVADETADLSERPDAMGYLSVSRAAGPDGRLTIHTEDDRDDSSDDAKSFDPIAMRLDGKPLTAAWRPDPEGGFNLEGEAARRLLLALREGHTLTLGRGSKPMAVSLSGLTAVLLAMDEAQGRLGSVTALVRTGPAPASAIPPAPSLPVIRSAPSAEPLRNAPAFARAVRLSQIAALRAHNCSAEQPEDSAYPLNHREVLVVLSCGVFAYQTSVLLLRAPRDAPAQARLVALPNPPTLEATDTESLGEYVEGGWDPDSATFRESAKGRGLADCGISTEWAFDGEVFRLSQFSRQLRCGGPKAGDWPTLWRTEVRPDGQPRKPAE